jgi:hypothetical protein
MAAEDQLAVSERGAQRCAKQSAERRDKMLNALQLFNER